MSFRLEVPVDECGFCLGPSLRPHRPGSFDGPKGPNEDLAQCGRCWAIVAALRPAGETFGTHLADCSLPERHPGYCEPGGSGHPVAETIRGYFPPSSVEGVTP